MTTDYVAEFIKNIMALFKYMKCTSLFNHFKYGYRNDMLEQAQAEINNKYAFIYIAPCNLQGYSRGFILNKG